MFNLKSILLSYSNTLYNTDKAISLSEKLFVDEEDFSSDDDSLEIEGGFVKNVADGIATISSLQNSVGFSELVIFESGVVGLIIDISEDTVRALILGNEALVLQGDYVEPTYSIVSIPVGTNLLGRVVDALGNPLDGEKLEVETYLPVELDAPGIVEREPVNQTLRTGMTSIDVLIPIGRGQRELIIGDRQTGKSTVALDTIISHRDLKIDDLYKIAAVYVVIGQKRSSVLEIVNTLKRNNAFNYTTIVAATAAEAAGLQYLAPYSGATIAEFFRDNQMDSVIIYDDLSKQATAYRQMSLLLGRSPAREAYPGDVFYLHSRLLERAAKLSADHGNGSLTAFPIVETQLDDVSAYIPTNLISITDGQIYLDTQMFRNGFRPALNSTLSVSRVGSLAQIAAVKELAGRLKLELAQYREVESFAVFGANLDEVTKLRLSRGVRLLELLKQKAHSPLEFYEQALLVYTGLSGSLDKINLESVVEFKKVLSILCKDENFVSAIVPSLSVSKNERSFVSGAIASYLTSSFNK